MMLHEMVKKSIKPFAALVMVVSLVFAMAIPTFAATTVAGDANAVTLSKYLVMDINANVPPASFSFAIAVGEGVAATGTTPAIMPGPVTPAITATATFASTDTTYTTVQDGDTVTLNSGQKYAKKQLTVDLSGVTFTQPGVYRYVITESGSADGVTNDANTSRYLDVYVITDDDGNLSIAENGYVLHPTVAVAENNTNYAVKDDGFTQTYVTKDLSLTKQITGNQGYRDKYFAFTVTVANATPGTKYTVAYSNGAVSGAVGDGLGTNPTFIEVGADGTVSQVFYLNDEDTITIQGLTEGNTYAISEENGDYTASYTLDAGTSQDGNRLAAVAMGDTNHAVVFTNDRAGTVPTGILIEIAPYLLVLFAACVAVVLLFLGKRRKIQR